MSEPQVVDVNVVILLDPITPAPAGFRLESRIANNNQLNFRNNGHPGFIVMFHIVDKTVAPQGAGAFRFADGPANALWVRPQIAPADGCPAAQCSWSQFEPQTVTGNGQTLIVRNRNEFTQTFGYVLNVTRNANGVGGIQPIDPIGNNLNGPQ